MQGLFYYCVPGLFVCYCINHRIDKQLNAKISIPLLTRPYVVATTIISKTYRTFQHHPSPTSRNETSKEELKKKLPAWFFFFFFFQYKEFFIIACPACLFVTALSNRQTTQRQNIHPPLTHTALRRSNNNFPKYIERSSISPPRHEKSEEELKKKSAAWFFFFFSFRYKDFFIIACPACLFVTASSNRYFGSV